MKGLKVLLVMLLVGCIASGVYAKPAEVYLMPSSPGEPSKMVPVGDKATADLWLEYTQGGTPNYLLSGVADIETVGVFFQPPAGCTLLAIEATATAAYDPAQNTFEMFAALSDPTLTSDAWEEYHGASATPGPSPIEEIIEGPTLYTGISDVDWTIDTLWVSSTPDVGKNPFFGGWIKAPGDSSPNPYIYANATQAPFHAIVWRSSPASETPGWYSSWHIFRVRALVRIYENIGPIFEVEGLPGTYDTGNRTVEIYTEDFGPTAAGIGEIHLYYCVEGKADTLEVTVVQDSVDDTTPNFEYAWWHAEIPGQSAGSMVHYWVEGIDKEGAPGSSPEYSYYVGGGTPGNILLYAESDAYYPYAHDPVNAVSGIVDTWDERSYGKGDESVFDFYITGLGQKVIVWIAWQGYTFDANTTSIASFLDAGGNLCLSGQDIFAMGRLGTELTGVGGSFGEWIAPEGSFARDYLKVQGGYDDYYGGDENNPAIADTAVILYGNPDHPISGNLEMIYEYPLYWAGYGYNYCGRFDLLDVGATPIFVDGFGETMAYSYEDGYKLVVLYWPFNNIVLPDFSDADTASQNTLIRNILSYFSVVGVEESPEPVVYKLPVVSPNPLSRPTTINFSIPKNGYVSVKVYDVTGSLVTKLVDERLTAGAHTFTIDTESLTSGVYFLKMDAGTFSGTRKFVVMK